MKQTNNKVSIYDFYTDESVYSNLLENLNPDSLTKFQQNFLLLDKDSEMQKRLEILRDLVVKDEDVHDQELDLDQSINTDRSKNSKEEKKIAQRDEKKEEVKKVKRGDEKGEEKIYELWQAMDFEK